MAFPEFLLPSIPEFLKLIRTKLILGNYLDQTDLPERVRKILSSELHHIDLELKELNDADLSQAFNIYTAAFNLIDNTNEHFMLGWISLQLGYISKIQGTNDLARIYFYRAISHLSQAPDARRALPLKMLATINLNS